jgi:cytochrome bd-type quinol oxidase subunit 2
VEDRLGFLSAAAVKTVLALVAAGALYAVLGVNEGSSSLAQSQAWDVWKITASLGMVLALLLGITGAARLHRLFTTSVRSRWWVLAYLALAVALSMAVILFLDGQRDNGRQWPFDVQWRVALAIAVVAAAAVPWVALVWAAHDLLHRRAFLGPATGSDVPALREAWALVTSIVFVFAMIVVISLVTTGALRAAWLSQDGDREALLEAFPSSDVLLYGAFFALLLAAITFPLVASYRQFALRLVNGSKPIPADGQVTKDWMEDRARLEALVHLDIGVFRNPLTALSVFTPLVTAALAAFIPELTR